MNEPFMWMCIKDMFTLLYHYEKRDTKFDSKRWLLDIKNNKMIYFHCIIAEKIIYNDKEEKTESK